MSTIKFNVEDSKAAEILKVIMNSGIAVTYVELTGDQYPQTRKYSTPSVNQSREVDTPTFTFVPDAEIVGGTIFYIDDKADGVYEFYDIQGNVIKNVQVGDRPYAYKVISPGSKDKYYVYHDEIYSNLRWTYCKDKGYAYESLGTSNDIGSGKTNTEKVMAKDNGAYITADSDGLPTIWYQLQQARLAKAGGCDDWFVPSASEAERLREAIVLGSVTGGTIAGSSYGDSVFYSKQLWSSSESSSQSAWVWSCYGENWLGSYKDYSYPVFFTRAF